MDKKKTLLMDEYNKLSPEEQSYYDSNVTTDSKGNKSGYYILKGAMTEEQKKAAANSAYTGATSAAPALGEGAYPTANYNSGSTKEKEPSTSKKVTVEDKDVNTDEETFADKSASPDDSIWRLTHITEIPGQNSKDKKLIDKQVAAVKEWNKRINTAVSAEDSKYLNGVIAMLEQSMSGGNRHAQDEINRIKALMAGFKKGKGGNGSSVSAQKPTTTPTSAKTAEQIKAEKEALEKKADESVDKSVNDVVSAANTEDANKTSQVGAIEPDVQKLIDDINNDTDAEYDENLPRSILNAWRAGKFGDKDSKYAKATRNYYIMDAISNGITNATRYIPGAYGRNDATSDSEFNTLIKKEAENAIERKNENIKERNNAVRNAYKDAIGNDIDTNKKIQDLKTAGIWTSYDSKMDYDKQASKLLFTELLGDDIMKYSPEEKKKLAAGLSYAADGKYDKAAAVFASDDPNFAANLLKHASEDVQNTERGNKMLDSALAIRMADIMQKYGIQNKGIDQDYLMQTIQTQFNNSKTMAEFQNNLNKDFADHQMTNDMKKAALDAALQYVKGKLPC